MSTSVVMNEWKQYKTKRCIVSKMRNYQKLPKYSRKLEADYSAQAAYIRTGPNGRKIGAMEICSIYYDVAVYFVFTGILCVILCKGKRRYAPDKRFDDCIVFLLIPKRMIIPKWQRSQLLTITTYFLLLRMVSRLSRNFKKLKELLMSNKDAAIWKRTFEQSKKTFCQSTHDIIKHHKITSTVMLLYIIEKSLCTSRSNVVFCLEPGMVSGNKIL